MLMKNYKWFIVLIYIIAGLGLTVFVGIVYIAFHFLFKIW